MKNWWNGFWEGVKTGASQAWEGVKGLWNTCVGWFNDTIINPVKTAFESLWNGIKDFLSNPLEGIKGMFKSAFNWIIGKVNWVIDGLNKFQVPDWVPLLGGKGINIPRIPELWKGSNFTLGGPTLVGEQGPELVNMPRGASVLPAHKTRSALKGAAQGATPMRQSANIYVELDGRTIAELVNMPRGASVLPAHKTRSALKGAAQGATPMRQSANIYVELDGRTIAKATGQELVDIIRLKTGLTL